MDQTREWVEISKRQEVTVRRVTEVPEEAR